MDKFILINLNMFTLNHQVFFANGNTGMSTLGAFPLEQLPAVIDQATDGADTNKVRIIGNELYAENLIELVKSYELRKYSKNIIDIEVIK